MKQLELLSLKAEPKWERVGPPGTCASEWRHHSGWIVRHCGHPTANFPYYAISPEGDGPIIAAHGRCFQKVQQAKDAVEGLLAGFYRMSRDGRIIPCPVGPKASKGP